ncbi:hypothetical protein IVB18_12770 [Bradyrhizobium sp. 186]|uniref:hypothetical protein n=1 Tax=Bradyrhizobium sp. 186 TaxID=2782654 RepID=UPI002000FEC5|nr:hypothetical protein [Bradyrhizobium sp. 186]UPK38070.1 hypothetical protein IVB18_12770 [Bradyrhizobium sp. 186]
MTDRIGRHEALILPLVLLIAFLFVLGIMTGAHLHERADRSLLYASFSAWACPCLSCCRTPAANR